MIYIHMGMRQQEREHVYDQRRWRGHEWGPGEEGGGEKQTTGAEECETEYDQLRQGSFDFEWGSFLCAPVR